MVAPGLAAQRTVNIKWDPNVASCALVCEDSKVPDSPNGTTSEVIGESSSCIVQRLVGLFAQGIFSLPPGVTSATIHGWWNTQNARPSVIVGNAPTSLPLAPVNPAQATSPCEIIAPPRDVSQWQQFSTRFDLKMGMLYNSLTIQVAEYEQRGLQFNVMFQNMSISYDPTGSPPSQTGQSSSNATTQTIIPPTSAPSQSAEPSSAIVGASVTGGPRISTAAVVVPAVLCAIFGVAALTFGTLWWLQRRRSLAPSAAYRANPETAWVPIDEKRQPTPGPSI